MKIIDISPLISEKTAVFPGDQVFERTYSLKIQNGKNIDLSSIKMTVHIGAHADAESHYSLDGKGVDKKPLEHYYGPCQVIQVQSKSRGHIELNDFDIHSIKTPRILFCTNSYPNPEEWCDDFMGIDSEVIDQLAQKGVFLVGIDTPSVDLSDSKELPAHKALLKNRMSVLEGIVLTHVAPGEYLISALPLKISGADAAPVRAVLISN